MILALIALIYGGKIIYETLVHGASVPGYPSVFVGVMVLGAVQLVMLGVVGEYIGKILYEIKARPVYFVAEHDVKLRDDASEAQHRRPAPPPNERTPDYPLCRRLRHLACGQRRNPRSYWAQAHQCHVGDGRGAELQSERSGCRCSKPRDACAIGLHVTLTAPFAPALSGFEPLRDGAFLSLSTVLLRRALARHCSPSC